MSKIEKPEFRLKRVYSDGSSEEPELYELKDIDLDWTMDRRGFLITSALGISLLNGCDFNAPKKVSSQQKADALVMTGECAADIKAHTDSVNSVSFSPDGKLLASGSFDKTIKLWEMPSGKLLRTLKGHADFVNSAVYLGTLCLT